jgi:hypothetical protein
MKPGDAVTAAFVLAAAAWSLVLNGWLPEGSYERSFINIWFESDIGRVVANMTDRQEGHTVAFKHPVFSILLYPPTALLMLLGATTVTAVAAVLAVNAALFAWTFDRLLCRLGLDARDRLLAGALCLGAGGFVFWFGTPETFPFGATTILLALLVLDTAFRRRPAGPGSGAWAWATAISMSMTITNVAVAAGAGLVALGRRGASPFLTVRTAVIGAMIGVIGLAALAVAQDRLFGNAGLFFNVRSLAGETKFFAAPEDTSPAGRLQTLYVQTVVVAEPAGPQQLLRKPDGSASGALRSDGRWPASATGLVAGAGWGLLLLAAAGAVAWRARSVPTLVWISLAFLCLNTAIHLVYGARVFLYAAHFLGPLLLVVLWGVLVAPPFAARRTMRALLAFVAVMAAVSNVAVFRDSAAAAGQLHAELLAGPA